MSVTSNLGPWVALAGVFVGAGIYYGLRESPSPSHPADASLRPNVEPARAGPAPSARAAIADFLLAQKPALQVRCWDDAVRAGMDPRPATFRYDVTVDTHGRQVIRSILETPGDSRAAVARCLQRETAPVQIGPTGVAVSAVVPMTFP